LSYSGPTATTFTHLNADHLPGLYIHIPFCDRKCPYCAFYSQSACSDQIKKQYLSAAIRDIQQLPHHRFDTVYCGGGTPSSLPIQIIKTFIEELFTIIDQTVIREMTIEINPGHVTELYMKELQQLGFNRFSFGIQSFNAEKRTALGRLHSDKDIKNIITITSGLTNYSVDLMFGLETDAKLLKEELAALTALRPPHISLYNLKIEPGTPFESAVANGSIKIADDDAQADQYNLIRKTLTEAGYRHYEISNFCLPGFASEHNLKYWRMTPWYGIGPGAAGYNGIILKTVGKDLSAYINGTCDSLTENLSAVDIRRYEIMMGLRTDEGVALTDKETGSVQNDDRLSEFIIFEKNRLMIKQDHWFVSNGIIAEVLGSLGLE